MLILCFFLILGCCFLNLGFGINLIPALIAFKSCYGHFYHSFWILYCYQFLYLHMQVHHLGHHHSHLLLVLFLLLEFLLTVRLVTLLLVVANFIFYYETLLYSHNRLRNAYSNFEVEFGYRLYRCSYLHIWCFNTFINRADHMGMGRISFGGASGPMEGSGAAKPGAEASLDSWLTLEFVFLHWIALCSLPP